ncbi:MAG TPA: hypothetical protein VFC19_44495 [Candidatus Limnocylindrales bacterium]|nr:hypothetical protein [Candidatus Limnocylindrales bacterium]
MNRSPRITLLTRTLAASLLLAPLGVATPAGAADCIPSGTEANINAALNGPGAVAVLCQDAVFTLSNSVSFTAPNQRLTTDGQPTDDRRALLRLAHGGMTVAVSMENQSGVVLENIRIDGMGREFGNRQGAALVYTGGNASDQIVRHIKAGNTRGWPMIVMFHGVISNNTPACQRVSVVSNEFGPSMADNGFGSDGIMVACGNSLVANNLVRDPTDVGIVIFGAPGTLVQGNHVVAETQELPGGIHMVDYHPMGGNYTNTRVDGNIVEARGHFIRVGIAVGPWVYGFCDDPTGIISSGGSVTNNTLRGQFMGFGLAVAGVANFYIAGNVDESRHVGRTSVGGCGGFPPQPYASPGFLYHPSYVRGTSLQPGFVAANVADLTLHTSLPPILLLPPTPPASCGRLAPGEWLAPNQSVFSCDGRFQLALQGDSNLVLYWFGFPLWASNTAGRRSAMAVMQYDGNFVQYDLGAFPLFSSGTVIAGSQLAIQDDGNVVVYAPWGQPLWATNTCCH